MTGPQLNVGVERITPAYAAQLLETNTDNRTVRPARVAQYADAIYRGEWQLNGEAIRIAGDGTLLDGQHRLHAVIAAEKPIQSLVIKGLTKDAYATMDQGLRRTVSDVLKQQHIKYGTQLGAITRLAIAYEERDISTGGRLPSYSTRQVVDRVNSDEGLQRAIAQVNNLKLYRIMPYTAAGFVIYLATKHNPEKAAEFLVGLTEGERLARSSMIYKAREQMLNIHTSRKRAITNKSLVCAALCLKAFKMFCEGSSVTRLQWRSSEPFPYLEE